MKKQDGAPLALTIGRACALLSIGRSTMYKWMQSGKIRAVKAGSKTLIPYAEAQRCLESLPPVYGPEDGGDDPCNA
jgi:excisionase family DNA binding protein